MGTKISAQTKRTASTQTHTVIKTNRAAPDLIQIDKATSDGSGRLARLLPGRRETWSPAFLQTIPGTSNQAKRTTNKPRGNRLTTNRTLLRYLWERLPDQPSPGRRETESPTHLQTTPVSVFRGKRTEGFPSYWSQKPEHPPGNGPGVAGHACLPPGLTESGTGQSD